MPMASCSLGTLYIKQVSILTRGRREDKRLLDSLQVLVVLLRSAASRLHQPFSQYLIPCEALDLYSYVRGPSESLTTKHMWSVGQVQGGKLQGCVLNRCLELAIPSGYQDHLDLQRHPSISGQWNPFP